MDSEILLAVIGLYLFISVVASLGLIREFIDDPEEYIGSPKNLYEESEMNILGVLITVIVLAFCVPLYYIVIFSHWITHVGRRK